MEHNFIDKIAPVIDLLMRKDYSVKLIKCMHNYNYDADLNLKYLLKKHPSLVIQDMFSNQNKLYSMLHKMYNYFNFKQSIQTNYLSKILYYSLTTFCRRSIVYVIKYKNSDFEKLSISKSTDIAILDLTDSDFLYKQIRRMINKKGITNYAFHHAFNIISNYLTTYNHLVRKKREPYDKINKYADKIVMYNSFAIEHIDDLYLCDKVKLPSLRYSTQWIKEIQVNKKSFKVENENAYKLKIVFMLTHVDYNVWKEELFRTVQMVLMNSEICLVIKVHPRSIKEKNKFLKIKAPNFKVVANEVSSSALIEWSDIVMNMSSGIIMEAIIKRKTIFYMKYLHCNTITPEETKNIIHIINTRDHLTFLLALYKENKQQNFIDENEVREFLKDYIGNDDYEENCQKYLTLLEKL